MKKMIRTLSVVLALSLLAVVFTGCSGGNVESYAEDGSYIYNEKASLMTPTNYTAEQLDTVVPQYMKDNGVTGAVFAEVEAAHGVNALFLIAMADYESGAGTSENASEEFKNYLGSKAVGIFTAYESYEAGVRSAGKFIAEKYLTEGARFYAGSTLKDLSTVWGSTQGGGAEAFQAGIGGKMAEYYAAING